MNQLILNQGNIRYMLSWELLHQDNRCKRIKVWPAKNPDLFIVLENNEPLIRGKGLKKRRIDWKQIEGPTRSQATIDQIVKEITNPSKPSQDIIYTTPTYNRKKKPDDQTPLGDRNKPH